MIGPIGWEEVDDRQTDDRQTTVRQADRKFESLYTLWYLRLLRRLDNKSNNNKVDMQFPHILVRKLHTQACEIVAGTKRKLCKKFQVDICKTKKDRFAHVQLHTL